MSNTSSGVSYYDKALIRDLGIPVNTVIQYNGDDIPEGFDVIDILTEDKEKMFKKYVANVLKQTLKIFGDYQAQFTWWNSYIVYIVMEVGGAPDATLTREALNILAYAYKYNFKGSIYALNKLKNYNTDISNTDIDSLINILQNDITRIQIILNNTDTQVDSLHRNYLRAINLTGNYPLVTNESISLLTNMINILDSETI